MTWDLAPPVYFLSGELELLFPQEASFSPSMRWGYMEGSNRPQYTAMWIKQEAP